MAVQRRLAAILAADVAGYSRLMGEDEEGIPSRQPAMNGHASDRYSIVPLLSVVGRSYHGNLGCNNISPRRGLAR